MNVRAVPGMIFDNEELYPQVLDKIKTVACRFVYHEINGSHHVHLNEPEKIGPFVFDFIKTNKTDESISTPPVNGSVSSSS